MRPGVLVGEIRAGIGRHRLRSGLVSLTFAIGFASVLIIIATVEGGRSSIKEMLRGLGVDVIACFNPVRLGPVSIGTPGGPIIDQKTLEALERELGEDVRNVIPIRVEMTALHDSRSHVTTTLTATTPAFAEVLRAGLLAGRFLEPSDRFEEDRCPVVLDEALARDFFADPAEAVGAELDGLREGQPYRAHVVGVMKDPILLRRHLDTFDAFAKARRLTARRLEFRNVYIPYDPVRDAPSGGLVQVWDVAQVEAIDERVTSFFAARRLRPLYYVQKMWVDSLVAIVDRFSFLTHFLWMLDLVGVLILVGTIAMLAVEERYAEVAIRRAEGARVSEVVIPLLGEGLILALVALPVGYGFALWILEQFVQPVLVWEPRLPQLAIYGTPVLFLLVGAATNLLPARRVARISPARVLGEYGE